MGQGPSQHCLQDLLDQQCLDKRSVLVKDRQSSNRLARREVQPQNNDTRSSTILDPATLNGRHTRASLPYGRVTDKLLQQKKKDESWSNGEHPSGERTRRVLSEISTNESNRTALQNAEHGAKRHGQSIVKESVQKWAERGGQFSRSSSVESVDGGQGGGDKNISRCRKLHPCRYAKASSQTSGNRLQSRPSFAGVVARDRSTNGEEETGLGISRIAAADSMGQVSLSPEIDQRTQLRPEALFSSPPPRSDARLSSLSRGYETARSCQDEKEGRADAVAVPSGSMSERGHSAPRILEVKMLSARHSGGSANRPLDSIVF